VKPKAEQLPEDDRPTEDDIAVAILGAQGVPGQPPQQKMTRREWEQMPKHLVSVHNVSARWRR
jgi:hypothetical protein